MPKDKIKIIVFVVLITLLITALFIYGQDSIVMKYVSGFCLATWLTTMFIVNKKLK